METLRAFGNALNARERAMAIRGRDGHSTYRL